MQRRNWLKMSAMAVAGMAATGKSNGKPLPWTDDPYERLNYVPIEPYKLDSVRDRIPQKGEEFNESFVFQDESTGKLTRRLTSFRQFNQKPTYHLNDGFSKDNRHLVFMTWNPSGGSAMVRSNLETGDCKVIDSTKPGELQRFSGQEFQMIPGTDFVSLGGANVDSSKYEEFVFYDIFSLKKEVVLRTDRSETPYSRLAGTCDGKTFFTTKNDHHFNYRNDAGRKDPYQMGGSSLYALDLSNSKLTEIYRTDTGRVSHPITNPVYPEWMLFMVSFPPTFPHGSDYGKTERTYILNLNTGKVLPVRHRNKCKFTWHANWNYDGRHIYYHGPSLDETPKAKASRQGENYRWPYKGLRGIEQSHFIGNGEHFIGVADLNGEVVWEHTYPVLSYGHVSSHTQKNVIIVHNLIAYEYLSGIHWEELNSEGLPMIETLAKHNSTYAPGAQTRHPHAQMTWDGRWMSYNAQFHDRSDVYVVKMI